MRLDMFGVEYFLVYLGDFHPKIGLILLFLLEMNGKTNSQEFAKIPLFVDKLRHEALLYLEIH